MCHCHVFLAFSKFSLAIPKVQILLASARAAELRALIKKATQKGRGIAVSRCPPLGHGQSLSPSKSFDQRTAEKMIILLEDYVAALQGVERGQVPTSPESDNYFIPSEVVSSTELAEFENVYTLHCPSLFLDSTIRDVCLPALSTRSKGCLTRTSTDSDAVLLLLKSKERVGVPYGCQVSWWRKLCHSFNAERNIGPSSSYATKPTPSMSASMVTTKLIPWQN